jgi:arylsulfatase A-like enzyme
MKLPIFSVFLSLLLALPYAHPAETKRPNILILFADDLGYADVGANGCADIPTPCIDSLAKHGVRCTSGYVSSCMCSPSRAGLLTGRSQSRFGHEINWEGDVPSGDKGLPPDEKTFADLLKAGGYRTGIVGKWHLGNEEKFHPLNRGFDEFFGFLNGSHDYLRDPRERNLVLRQREPVWGLRREEDEAKYLTTVLGDEAAAFIHRHRERPWFLYLAFNAPHTPLQATRKHLDRVSHISDPQRRTYAAMVAAMDDAIGVVLAQLRADGLEESTLVVFLSDNGGPLERNGSRNTPLSGEKGGMLEGGIRVPFLVQWKGGLPAGRDYNRPVSSLDLLPTALAISSTPAPANIVFDGVNLIPFLTGEQTGDPHAQLFWRMKARDIWAARVGDFKLVMQREKKGKHPGGLAPRLIDLASDLRELTDLAARQPEVLAGLRQRYDSWNATLPEPLWGPGADEDGDTPAPRPRRKSQR